MAEKIGQYLIDDDYRIHRVPGYEKPISLIERISSLFKLPEECDQKVYIPFCDVFSEIIGFVKAGYKIDNIYGCELSEDYYNIGLKRLEHYTKKFNKPKSSLEKFLWDL